MYMIMEFVPPAPVRVTVAVPPLHAIGVVITAEPVNNAGSVIVTFAVAVHKLASVTITVNGPADSPAAVTVVCPGVVFHE